ncbi:CheR family methyltransferase [Pararhodospirillum oryzae]|uniref:Chemotaxis protein methyltransferase n=1 Tax=Pararhodospirillum oryzae TaxID=478448 RepID=A0A512H7A9_9PROT|nr:protein-glutamate O-methyltransferase CheR [Pararhodospirillum oryzae]GEO81339.1 chemotaxis protein methyltransferase [Pararhodospirillum oryzae]
MVDPARSVQPPPPPPLTDEEYAKFCEFFYRKTGIQFQDNKKYYVERRLVERMTKTGSSCFRDYFTMVRFQVSGEELQSLVNTMTVNETYFFREDYQFVALVEGMLPELVRGRSPRQPLRLWSVPCSSGEEPYSIALSILERWDQADHWDIEIHASDIDSRILAEAQAGVFGARSLSRVPRQYLEKYFVSLGDGSYRICDDLRQSIDFSLVNIVDPVQAKRFRDVDVIFCRNLLIYFDDVGRRETVETLYEILVPGGYVCLGHSESMSRMTSLFVPRKFGDTIVYQKPQEKAP